MAISSALLKGVAGLGAASTLTAGGVGWYTQKEVKYETIDEFVLNSKEGIGTISKTTNTPSATNNIYEITTKLTGKNNNEGKTGICKIKGTAPSPVSESSGDMEGQLTSLKAEIGIEENKTRDFEKNEKFKKFFENCKRHKEAESTYTINLGNFEINEGSYKFKNSDFQRIYEGKHGNQELKEKQLNITCTENSCSIMPEKQLDGFTAENSQTISITKNTQEDPERFNDGISYSISGTNNSKDGNYKIDEKAGGGFELKKVENLVLKDLCEKIGLTYDDESPSDCSKPANTNTGITNFYENNNNYTKGLKITEIGQVEFSIDFHTFKLSGNPRFDSTKAEGTMKTVSTEYCSIACYVKYVPKLKAYAFVKKQS